MVQSSASLSLQLSCSASWVAPLPLLESAEEGAESALLAAPFACKPSL